MCRHCITAFLVLLIMALSTNAQVTKKDSAYRKFFIGSSFFVLGNFVPDDPNPPDFVQLNFGYRLTPKNVIAVELKTWKYALPLGIPYGDSFSAPEEKYPGYTRDFGIALVYQRFWWKGLYTAIHAMSAFEKHYDGNGRFLQNGYMLFMTYRLGYHIPLFKNRFFIEPSVAMTHWPVKTNLPGSFKAQENKWSNHFFPEPGLHFGVKF